MTRLATGKDERGMALLSTIFTVLLLTAIGMAMIYASNMDSMINANYRDKQRAQYASVSGVQEARDRIQPVNVVAQITAPLVLPALGAANVIYIVNPQPGDSVEPWDADNPYFDNELCQERVLGLTGTPGVPCTSTAAGSWYTTVDDSQSSSAPWNFTTPLATKWTRIMLKANNMGVVPVNGNSADATQVCWDGVQQAPSAGELYRQELRAEPQGPDSGRDESGQRLHGAAGDYDRRTRCGGTQATATARWQPDVPTDRWVRFSITSGGANLYERADVTITGGGGSGATAVAEIVDPGAPLSFLTLNSPGAQCFASAPSVVDQRRPGQRRNRHCDGNSGYNCIYSIAVGANCPGNDSDHVHGRRAEAGPDSQRPSTRRPEADRITCSAGSICT